MWRLRSSWWDLRDVGKGVMSLRSPESRTGAAEARAVTREAGGQGLWPGARSRLAALPRPTLKRTREPVASAVSPLLPRAPGIH